LAPSRHQVEQLLEYCINEQPITALMNIFNWNDRTKFKKKFINPMLEMELLSMTIPDKPKSSKQKYIITAKGKELLES
jgi:ATP-dependent DNA helicase RecG